MIVALREYAADWIARLRNAPNHAGNWLLVQMVQLSTDESLVDWVYDSDSVSKQTYGPEMWARTLRDPP